MSKFKKIVELHLNLWDITLAWAIWKILDWLWLNKVDLLHFIIEALNSV